MRTEQLVPFPQFTKSLKYYAEFLDPAVQWSCTTDVLFTPAGEIIVLRVSGEIDLLTLPLLEAALDAHLDQQPDHLLVDLAAVTYCCARGMNLLVTTADHAAGQGIGYAVSGLPPWLDRIWRTLFHDETPVRYRSVATAVTAVQARHAEVPIDLPVQQGHLRAVPTPTRQAHRDGRMIRVLVVDDHAFLRDALAVLLTTAADIAVVGRCANGAEALAVVPTLRPDVILMDVAIPVLDGVETARLLREAWPDARVVILTASLDGNEVPAAYQAGAVGYLPKSVDPEDLIEAVRTVHAGCEAWDKRAAALRRWTGGPIRPGQGMPL